jgi:chromosome segregation ATPase
MSGDDLTNNPVDSSEDDKATKPTITAVFRLLQEVQNGQTGLNSRIEGLESRLDRFESSVNSRFEALELRLTNDFASVNARFAEMKGELLRLSDKLSDRIDRSRLHAEADIEDITRRLRKLEAKALETGEDRSPA